MDEGFALLVVGAILGASVALALGASRTGLPVLVAFLGLGMLLGSDGPGGIEFDNAHLAREAGTIGLALILYEGGLQTSWRRLRSVAAPAGLLSTVGVLVTACITGVVAQALFDLTWLEAFLVGAVVASTDAAAVFSTLRFTHIPRRVARTLEAESGGNDPMAIALTLGLIAWIEHPRTSGLGDLVVLLVRQLGIGLACGVVLGVAIAWLFARIPESIGAFVPVASVAAAALSFGVADTLDGSGFLAVYLVGLAVGSTPSRYRRQLAAFHEGVAFVAQVWLFVLLGLLVFPHELPGVALPGLALALMFVARPVAVWISTLGFSFQQPGPGSARLGRAARRRPDRRRDLRARVTGQAQRVDLQHRLLRRPRLRTRAWHDARARRRTTRPRFRTRGDARVRDRRRPAQRLELVEFVVETDHAINGSAVCELGLPRDTLVAAIQRDGDAIPPRGSTIVEADDRLYVLVASNRRPDLDDVVARWRRAI